MFNPLNICRCQSLEHWNLKGLGPSILGKGHSPVIVNIWSYFFLNLNDFNHKMHCFKHSISITFYDCIW